jgi:hypothetical protein
VGRVDIRAVLEKLERLTFLDFRGYWGRRAEVNDEIGQALMTLEVMEIGERVR